ncbi:hypothetical protein ACRAWG_12620 [Methylobacterium sp. P31]
MKHAYTLHAMRGRETKKLPCASAWVAFEQHNRLVRQGWKVSTVSHAGKLVTGSQLEAAAQAETDTAVKGSEAG